MIKKALKRTLIFLAAIIIIFIIMFQLFSFYNRSYLFLEEFNNNVLCGEYTQVYDVNKADNYIDKNADLSINLKDGTVINNKYKYISTEIEKFINDNKLSIGFSLTNTSNNSVKYGLFKIEYENAFPLYIHSKIWAI